MLERKRNDNLIRNRLVALLVACYFLFAYFIFLPVKPVYASEYYYSNVLEDLYKNDSFDEGIYKVNYEDSKIELLTIAESENNELFVYTYQPAMNSYATSINISTDVKNKTDYDNYQLEYLNNSGVFYKYKVKNFILPTTDVRTYEISNIFRKFNDKIDTKPDNDNTIQEVGNNVGKQFVFDKGGALTVKDVENISVISKYIGYLRYQDSWLFSDTGCDVHFVAFTTGKRIDDLLEAQISYSYRTLAWTEHPYSISTTKDESGKEVKILKKGESIKHNSTGLFSKDENYQEILEADKFIEQHDIVDNIFSIEGVVDVYSFSKISDQTQEIIKNEKWVLTFAGYPYKCSLGQGKDGDRDYYQYTYVSEITLLRLRFITNGVEYNLGVVDNKSEGDLIADNIQDLKIFLDSRLEFLMMLILIIGLIVIILNIFPIVKPVFAFMFNGAGLIIKGAFKIVFLPAKIIFRKRPKNDDDS